MGKQGFGKQNSNGLHLVQLCNEFIGNTVFRQKNKCKGTWMLTRQKHWHIIDFVITRKRDLQEINVVKVMRGTVCWTDHRLVRAKLKLKIRSKIHRKAITPKKLDVAKLQSEVIRASLIHNINSLEPLNEENTWEDFKEKVYNTAKDITGIKRRIHQDWSDENDAEIQCLVKEKQQLHNKKFLPYLAAVEKEKTEEALRKMKAEIQRRLRHIQSAWWKEKAQALQDASNQRDSKSMYQLLKEVYGPKESSYAPLKSKDGKKILRRFKKDGESITVIF